jgi:hypothetical protein
MVLVILLEEKLMSDYARKYPLTKKKMLDLRRKILCA